MSQGAAHDVEAQIAKQAWTSLIAGVLGLVCCQLLAVWAIIAANNTTKLIALHDIGQEHRVRATVGKVLGIAALVIFALGIVGWLLVIVLGVGGNAFRLAAR